MDNLVYFFFLIFAGAAALATLVLYTRQPLLVAYIVLGATVGPHGLGAINDSHLITQLAEIGIIFLLFLLGLDMQPRMLVQLLRESMLVASVSSLVFLLVIAAVAAAFGTTALEALLIGSAAMFSSTIVGIKLLPTTVLHHRHVGELVVSLLLLQDLIAMVLLLALDVMAPAQTAALVAPTLRFAALPLLIGIAFATVRWILLPLIARFDTFHEFMFLLAVGWCLAVAVAAHATGLSFEMGAFIAGVALASHPIAQYVAESLRPLRDFFLVVFFFSVGASFDLGLLQQVAVAAVVLTAIVLLLKPIVFRLLLTWQGEPREAAWEVGWRLGQLSEFSLMLAYLAADRALISNYASHLIQACAIASLLASSYLVVFRYPSPISPIARLRRD